MERDARYGDGLASRSEEIGRRASAFNGNVFADLCLRGEERPMKVKEQDKQVDGEYCRSR